MENKPDWSTAPDWANWLAMDPDGEWLWHEEMPSFNRKIGLWLSDGMGQVASKLNRFDSLGGRRYIRESRPKPEQK